MKYFEFLIITVLLFSFGCSSGSGDQGSKCIFDTVSSTCFINRYNLAYRIVRPDVSIVAPEQNLPDDILMCLVDTASGISVILIELDNEIKDRLSAADIMKQICSQRDSLKTVKIDESISECQFLDSDAWKFSKKIGVEVNSDTMRVLYSGYIFNRLAIVATALVDSVENNMLTPYLSGLYRVKG